MNPTEQTTTRTFAVSVLVEWEKLYRSGPTEHTGEFEKTYRVELEVSEDYTPEDIKSDLEYKIELLIMTEPWREAICWTFKILKLEEIK